ncbi:MAG: PSD1 and planctomycete cytochrome C domain-containing protein, partial [Pirellula sp.]
MMLRRVFLCFYLSFIPVLAKSSANTDPIDSPAGIAFFESNIRPVLVEHCYQCHSAQAGASEGELQLDSRVSTRRGGDRGPAVVPGDPKASWLLTAMSHANSDLKMPPKRERLSDAHLADFRKWIEIGAPDPRTETPSNGNKAWEKASREFWAYQSPRVSEPPPVKDASWCKKTIDHFILAKLEQQELSPGADAQPHALLRRLRFDLVGLPPSPEHLTHFLSRIASSGLDAALSMEVDELLASSEFGERWGRHWLDVARFAESSGTEANISFPYAWRYRDYVIDCVNNDIPFDRFLLEQVAGDLLPYDNNAERARLLIATGFLAVGTKNLDAVDQRQFQADVVDEQIDSLTRAVIADSVACARCHDHKFDPFSMSDYYALAGIFASTKTFFGTAVSPSNRIGGDPLQLPKIEGQRILHPSVPKKRVEALKAQLAKLRAEKAEMDEALKAAFSGKKPDKAFTLQDALRVFWQTGGVEGELEKISDSGEALPLTMGVLEADQIVSAPLLERGDINKPGMRIPRAFPHVLRIDNQFEIPADQSGRLQLAQWLTHPKHPLTARVIVNRIWHHMFGAGIVATVDNFGSTGDKPSHPELLDSLAARFIQDGWSVKNLVREIALSRSYRQSSVFREAAFHRDPENRFLWRVS